MCDFDGDLQRCDALGPLVVSEGWQDSDLRVGLTTAVSLRCPRRTVCITLLVYLQALQRSD